MAENIFPLEKILTGTATEYCASVGRELSQYELVGVHVDDDLEFGAPVIKRFQEKVPVDSEVVVGFRYTIGGAGAGSSGVLGLSQTHSRTMNQYASGTALAPKNE
jgi:hypothetical protein